MAKFDIQAFFNNIEGKTWSLGSAFKRADALPLDLYSVWETKAEAEAYATSHATAYPGQILVVVEKENEVDVIKLYYIDENRTLQEVGSATLGDDKTIVLDPDSKILSIKGFENAGFAKTSDEKAVANKEYFTIVDGNYVKVENLEADSDITSLDYYERIAVKLIKDSAGNLNWITDDAVQIQGNISALQTTVENHEERIQDLEDGLEDVNDRIVSLGTVFNFVGSLTTLEFAATTDAGEDNLIDSDAVTPGADGRPYRAGDVVLVDGKQEYVAVATEAGLVWEAFGDPTGVAGIEGRVVTLEEASTNYSNALTTLNGDVNTEGSVAHSAKAAADAAVSSANGYTDNKVAEVKAIADTNKDEIFGKAAQGEPGTEGYVPAVEGLKDKVAKNATAIFNLDTALNKETDGVIARVTKLESESAKASDLNGLNSTVEALGNNLNNNYYTKEDIDHVENGYATKKSVAELTTTVNNNTTASTNNATAISNINTKLTGASDGTGSEGLIKTVNGLVSTTEGHGTKISAIEGKLDTINGTGAGSIAEAKAAAETAQAAANNAQKDATQALADAAAASQLAGTKATLADVADVGYALDTDAQGYAKAVQGETTETVASAYALADAANSAAGNAQSAANAAQGTADQAIAKFAEYTNTTDMNAAIAAVISDGEDSKDDITIKGTRLYAKDLADGLQTDIDDINTKLVDLTTVMNFVGKSTTDPSTGTVTIGGKVITPQLGDVVVYEAFEYVYTGETDGWEIFGNVTADESRFDAIETVIGSADVKDAEGNVTTAGSGLIKDVDDLQDLTATLKSTSDGYATRFTNAEGRIKVVEDTINDTTNAEGNTVKGLATRLTEVEGVAGAAATQEALNKEIADRGVAEAALDKKITDGFAGQNTVNAGLQANIDAIYKLNEDGTDSGLLTWGTF